MPRDRADWPGCWFQDHIPHQWSVWALEYGERVSRGDWVSQSGTASLLAEAYRRTPGGYIAFLDESFELNGDRKTFYLMSAVVTHRDQIASLREYWASEQAPSTPAPDKP